MADIGISESDIIGEVERFNSPDEMLIVEQQVSPTQINTEVITLLYIIIL